jgi:ribonuclease J
VGPRITVFDGHDSVGGTKILFAQGEVRLLLDFGTNYKRMGEFYEEYVRPRSARGIVDWTTMGLLPKIQGLYRDDVFPSQDLPRKDADWPQARPSAILLTHGHLDHCGGLGFVDPDIPVVCTPMTLALLRAWQDYGGKGGELPNEVTYLGRRIAKEEKVGGARARSGQLLEMDRAPKQTRRFATLGESPSALQEILRTSPYGERTEFIHHDPTPAPDHWDDVALRWNGVDHSVYGAVGFLLEGDGGCVGYTGDIRFHGERGRETERFAELLATHGSDLLLIMEGTRLIDRDKPQTQPIITEDQVEMNCRKDIERYEGKLVVADFGPRNVERLRRFRKIAFDTGRQLVLTPKDAYLLYVLHAVDPNVEVDLSLGGMRILEEPSDDSKVWQKLVRARFSDAYLSPTEIVSCPGKWILCFSFFDCNDLVDLRAATEGGLWLYSSSEAHGEEQEIDFQRLQNWIRWAGMTQVGFRYLPNDQREFELTFYHPDDVGHHASGHASQAELLDFIERVGPRSIVPVHTAQRPQRYGELLRDRGLKTHVLSPSQGIEIGF